MILTQNATWVNALASARTNAVDTGQRRSNSLRWATSGPASRRYR